MEITSAARVLGGNVLSATEVICPGPGHSASDRSLCVKFDSVTVDGFLVHSFAGDYWQVCRDYVHQRLGMGRVQAELKNCSVPLNFTNGHPPIAPDAQRKLKFANSLWVDACGIAGTLVERYLTGRGIVLTADTYDGHALRFHPACPYRLDSGEKILLPTMIAAMRNIHTNAFQGVHRTALAADGTGQAQVHGLGNTKKMLGSSKDAVVKLCSDETVTHGLGIAEGIETGLSIKGNVGFKPVWSTLSAVTMTRLPVLSGIECLSIFADNDPEKKQGGKLCRAGSEAAHQCAGRWVAAGRECQIWMPTQVGSDFNDIAGVAS